MKKISGLSKEQEHKLSQYRDKWLEIGLSTNVFTLEQARPIIDDLYKFILMKKKPSLIIILDSPLSTWIAISLVWNQVWSQVGHQVAYQVRNQVESQVRDQVRNQVWNQVKYQVGDQVENQVGDQVENQVGDQVGNQVWNQVWSQVRNQVWNQVKYQIRSQVGDQVWNQVWSQIWSQVWNQVWSQVGHQVRNQVENQIKLLVWPYCDGNFSASYFAFYDFIFSELIDCGWTCWEVYKKTSELSLIYPFDDICFLSQKPKQILLKNRFLHCEDGPAIEYLDGFSIWALNGVRVPSWLVRTRAEEIDPIRIFELENAQQRAEAARKVGIERLWHKCCVKILDERGDYELGLIPVEKGSKNLYPYLKMRNPSVPELWHVEGIPDKNCRTVEQALHSRKPEKMRVIPVSEQGEDWYQQGDVCVWPKDAKSLKPMPLVLT